MRAERIREKLQATLKPQRLEIHDDSEQHAGHRKAHSGGHFRVFIVCPAFSGRSLLARHRMVYEALSEQMRSEIHALSITARAPEEVSSDNA
jgi:BolA protein